MKMHVVSDLHREHPFEFPALPMELGEIDADFIVMAGDVDNANRMELPYLVHEKTGAPVIHICGNHEFYDRKGRTVQDTHEILRDRSKASGGVWYLENECVELPGRNGEFVRFIGATLWTDWAFNYRPAEAMKAARVGINDYRFIWVAEGADGDVRQLMPQDTLKWHLESRTFIERTLSVPFDGPTVVVTHHAAHEAAMRAPSTLSSHERAIQPAYGSDLMDLLKSDIAPDFWISGHTHLRCDIDSGNTRLISNAQGYFNPETGLPENKHFDPELLIDLDDCPRLRSTRIMPRSYPTNS